MLSHAKQQRSLSLCLSAGAVQSAPITDRNSFNVVDFLTNNQMCGAGHLIGALEIVCSNPDGADPHNPDIQCDETGDDATDAQDTTTAASGGSVSTAASGGSVSTAASGGSVSTAASGGSVSTAASGGSVSTAASGGSVSTAASGGRKYTAASGGSATASQPKANGDQTTTAESSDSSWGTSVHGSCLHALVCVILLRVLLV